LIRQWKIVRALESARLGLSWSELIATADEPVSERTIRRDIDTLTFAGFPIDVESRQGGETTRIVMRRVH
jgi:predicted DNA-binding transcriptional regulator YafY